MTDDLDQKALAVADAIVGEMMKRGALLAKRNDEHDLHPLALDRQFQIKAGWQIIIAAALADTFAPHGAKDVFAVTDGGNSITVHFSEIKSAKAFRDAFPVVATPSPSLPVLGSELIGKIAQVATAVGWQANEPAMEIAGMIVSALAANPEHIERFVSEGTELLIDGTLGFDNGSLTYRANSGDILSPSALRKKKGTQQ